MLPAGTQSIKVQLHICREKSARGKSCIDQSKSMIMQYIPTYIQFKHYIISCYFNQKEALIKLKPFFLFYSDF